MKHMGKIVGIVLLLVVGYAISPAGGKIYEATQSQILSEETIEIEFWDFTNQIPIKTTLDLPITTWDEIEKELQEAKKSTTTIENQISQELAIFQKYNIISTEITVDDLQARAFSRALQNNALQNVLTRDSILNNSVISAMCAINFELSNGTTFVLGLNSFINLIGFNIVSVHKGYSPTGIEAKGLLSKTTTPGEFFGLMFGFLGYWYGVKTATGQYSSLTAAGFTVITAWIPVPEI